MTPRIPRRRRLALLPGLVLGGLGLLALAGFVRGAPGRAPAAPASPHRGPRGLRFLEATRSLGPLAPGREHTLVLPWERTGAGPLRLLGARSDCGCALVDGGRPRRLAAGERGDLTVRLRARRRPGPFSVRVRLISDARPPLDVVSCRLRGYVETAVALRPARLDLGARTRGRQVTRDVELVWSDAADLRLACGLPPVGDAADGVAPGAVDARLEGLGGRVAVAPAVLDDLPGRRLHIEFQVPAKPGAFEGRVRVTLAGRRLVALPIRGHVVQADGDTRRR